MLPTLSKCITFYIRKYSIHDNDPFFVGNDPKDARKT